MVSFRYPHFVMLIIFSAEYCMWNIKIYWSCDGILIVKAVSCCRYRTKYVRNSQLRDSGGNRLREETQPSAGRKAESKGTAVEDIWKGKSRSHTEVSFSFFSTVERYILHLLENSRLLEVPMSALHFVYL